MPCALRAVMMKPVGVGCTPCRVPGIAKVPIVPAAFLTYADYPLYALYELAPRVNGIAAITDQQAAGLIMKAVADPIIWLAMAVVFFRWQRVEEAADRAERERRGSGAGGQRGSS